MNVYLASVAQCLPGLGSIVGRMSNLRLGGGGYIVRSRATTYQGPVVQSIVSPTMLLRRQLAKYMPTTLSNMRVIQELMTLRLYLGEYKTISSLKVSLNPHN